LWLNETTELIFGQKMSGCLCLPTIDGSQWGD